MKVWSRLVILGVVLSVLAGCVRDDDEPIAPTRPISRLYISTSEFSLNPEVEVIQNVYVVEPADDESFSQTGLSYRTFAIGGSAIFYSPNARLLFQSAQNVTRTDNSVQVMNIDTLRGTLAAQGTVNSELITAVRGITYHPSNDLLFLVNARPAEAIAPPSLLGSVLATAGSTQSDLFVYSRPRSRNNPALPNYRIPFPDKVIRSVFLHDISVQQNDRRNKIYLSTTATQGEILAYNELPDRLLNNPIDSLQRIEPDFILNVPSSGSLTSMAYSPRLDLMVATDAQGAGQGRVLFFENFSRHEANATIAPSQIITGALTRLRNPVSIAIDDRERGKYLYVADTEAGNNGTSGAVLRFLITNEGNVAPDGVLEIAGRTPVGLSLDARGTIPESENNESTQAGTVRIGRR